MSHSLLRAVRALASAGILATNLLTLPTVAHAQPAGVTRTDLQRHDLSAPRA
jgi:hypothetical protein